MGAAQGWEGSANGFQVPLVQSLSAGAQSIQRPSEVPCRASLTGLGPPHYTCTQECAHAGPASCPYTRHMSKQGHPLGTQTQKRSRPPTCTRYTQPQHTGTHTHTQPCTLHTYIKHLPRTHAQTHKLGTEPPEPKPGHGRPCAHKCTRARPYCAPRERTPAPAAGTPTLRRPQR